MAAYILPITYNLSNRCSDIDSLTDSLTMLSDGFNFKITSDSFNLRL